MFVVLKYCGNSKIISIFFYFHDSKGQVDDN